MKKILFIALLAFGISVKAQITLEHSYDSASSIGSPICQLMIVDFELSGERYVRINRMNPSISIYNLNHTLIKTFFYPSSFTGNVSILYISEKLFDTDDAIEYMLVDGINNSYHTLIYKEDGTLVFDQWSGPMILINVPLQQYPIYNTSQGAKLILSNGAGADVYSLPGTLTTGIEIANQSLIKSSNLVSNAYPNPTNSTTRIDYTFPNGVNEGEIVFNDLQDREIKRLKVDKTFDHLVISTADIPPGTYFYQMQTANQASEGKKMVVIK